MNALSVATYPESGVVSVSVLIPMRNEEKYIAACLDSVLANDFPRHDFEIIVLDGRSTDRSRQIVQQYVDRYPFIRLLDNPGEIVPVGLNIGIRNACGRYIVRMDAHSEYPRDYIRSCVSELERTGAEMVGGSMTTRAGSDSLIGRAIALMSTHRFGVGNSAFRIGMSDRYVDTVPFGAFRRQVFDRVGLFRERLERHQDFEMASRIRSAGGRIFLSSKIHLTYYNVPTLKRFLRQAFMNGIWVGRAWVCYPSTLAFRKMVPVIFVASLLTCAVAGIFFPPALKLFTLILGTYAVAALVSAFQISRRHGWRFMFVMPWLFFAYHFVFGITLFAGLATFPRAKDSQRTAPVGVATGEKTKLRLIAGHERRPDSHHAFDRGNENVRVPRRSVLLIAYYYPPRRESGAVRPSGLAKHLSELGWEPVVLTPREPGRNAEEVIETDYVDFLSQWKRRLGFHPQKALRQQLGLPAPSIHEVRSGRKDLLGFVRWLFTYPDALKGWLPYAVRELELRRGTKFDAVISTGPPLVAHMIAARAKEIFGCPWIADFRDLWNIDGATFEDRRGIIGAIQQRTERKLLHTADALVTVSGPWAQQLRNRYPDKQVEAITNGFDPSEVADGQQQLTSKFTITHTGILYEGLRDPSLLLQVLQELVQAGEVDKSDLLLRFYGSRESFLPLMLARYSLKDSSEICASVPRAEVLNIQRESQLLLALSWASTKGRNNPEVGVHTGKIFEYIAARRPILAVGGVRGVLTELLEQTQAGVHALSKQQLRAAVLDAYREFKRTGRVPYHGDPVAMDNYSHPNMARSFARLLNEVVVRTAQYQRDVVTESVQQAC